MQYRAFRTGFTRVGLRFSIFSKPDFDIYACNIDFFAKQPIFQLRRSGAVDVMQARPRIFGEVSCTRKALARAETNGRTKNLTLPIQM